MQRWHLTLGLGSAALLAAIIVPELVAKRACNNAPATVKAIVLPAVTTPAPVAVSSIDGLTVQVGVDNPTALKGTVTERYIVVNLDGQLGAGVAVDRPINVAVVMDRSGSMGAQSKMSYAKQAAKELVDALDADDRFALVTFADHAEVPVTSTQVTSTSGLFRSIYAVQEGGGTNLYAGLNEGFAQVRTHLSSDSLNRVILLSDGNANVGITDDTQLAELAGRWTDSGVSVSAMGVGLDYNEDLLASMADQGGGAYRFIDNPSTLTAVFAEELQQLTEVAARGVQVSIETAPGVELIDVLGYDEELTDGVARVRIGDVRQGENRKVVIKVRVSLDQDSSGIYGTSPLANLSVSTVDAGLAGPFEPMVESTSDRAYLQASENRELSILVAQAEASVLADEATRAYERGDRQRMKSLIRASQSTADSAATRYSSDELYKQLNVLRDQERTFDKVDASSTEGVFQVKRAKEAYRASSR